MSRSSAKRSANLTPELKAAHTDIPWKQIGGMRDYADSPLVSVSNSTWYGRLIESNLPAFTVRELRRFLPTCRLLRRRLEQDTNRRNPVVIEYPFCWLSNFISTTSSTRTSSPAASFPPSSRALRQEPNGYLRIVGHATRAISIDFCFAAHRYGGKCNLPWTTPIPVKEDREVHQRHSRGRAARLGFQWDGMCCYASSISDQLYQWAGVASSRWARHTSMSLTAKEQVASSCATGPPTSGRPRNRAYRNRLGRGEPRSLSPDARRRVPDERYRTSPESAIARGSPNVNLRATRSCTAVSWHATHPHVGDKWCIYPTYDWAHGQSDSIEGVTYSLCSLEFENHRPLYDWYLDQLGVHNPRQIEFSRLNITYVVMSKPQTTPNWSRGGLVRGWDDPRMPTSVRTAAAAATLRRPSASSSSASASPSSRASPICPGWKTLCGEGPEQEGRPRHGCSGDRSSVVIENYPARAGRGGWRRVNNPEDPSASARARCRSPGVLHIERDDFRQDPPKDFFRLAPGREVRLRWAYFVKCVDVVKDPATGELVELALAPTIRPLARRQRSRWTQGQGKSIHWVSAAHAAGRRGAIVRSHLFTIPEPENVPEGTDWKPEPSIPRSPGGADRLQTGAEPVPPRRQGGQLSILMQQGYFCLDTDSKPGSASVQSLSITSRHLGQNRGS